MSHNRSVDEVDRLIGQRIKFYRVAAKMSQDSLGKKIGVSFQQIQKYEAGTNRISIGRLVSICEALNVDVRDLFEDLADRENKDYVQHIGVDDFKILNSFRELTPELKKSIVSLANVMKNAIQNS